MSRTSPQAIRAVGVERSYRRGLERVDVLRGVDLVLRSGEFVALMGPSGSGKSTLLNLIGGLDRPDRGKIEVLGTELGALSQRSLAAWRSRNLGLVFQFYHLMPSLSAARNVEVPLLVTPRRRAERRQAVAAALALTGLGDCAGRYPHQLSGGEQQRVGVARAIVANPRLLLCDEPTGDLDRAQGDRVLELLALLAFEHGKTVLMVTHDQRAASRASRVVYLSDGRIQGEATR